MTILKVTFSKAINLLSHRTNFVQLKHAVESNEITPSSMYVIISLPGI